MSESSPPYVPTTIAKVFELLDNKLVSLGIPGALTFVGITKARESQWSEAVGCFAGAVGVWLIIKIGNKLAPKLDQGLDWLIVVTERSLLEGLSTLRSDFEGQYLKRQAGLCGEFEVEGFTPDKTATLLLEEVFVPLDLSGAFVDEQRHRELARLKHLVPVLLRLRDWSDVLTREKPPSLP